MMMEENMVTAMQEQVEDRVVQETDRLAWRIVMEEAQEMEQISQAEICLRHCVGKMLERHSMVFGGMMVRLNIDRTIDFRQGFTEVAEELFRDAVSWSKIVALFAFGARCDTSWIFNETSPVKVFVAPLGGLGLLKQSFSGLANIVGRLGWMS